jgi:hypothetical protein
METLTIENQTFVPTDNWHIVHLAERELYNVKTWSGLLQVIAKQNGLRLNVAKDFSKAKQIFKQSILNN